MVSRQAFEAQHTGEELRDQRAGRPLVLVVDDYQDGREMCVEYLSFCGFGVAEAANGVEALRKAAEALPDLILMDLSLPGLDGWEVTRRLKADPRTAHIPVIALTAHALGSEAQRAHEAGCASFITKPCLPDALVVEVRRVLALAGTDAWPSARAGAGAGSAGADCSR